MKGCPNLHRKGDAWYYVTGNRPRRWIALGSDDARAQKGYALIRAQVERTKRAERESRALAAKQARAVARAAREAALSTDPDAIRLRDYYVRNRARLCADRKEYARLYPERIAAGDAVTAALRSGVLVRLPCEVCGDKRTEAHHPSYAPDAQLDVVWLCRRHHRQAHQT